MIIESLGFVARCWQTARVVFNTGQAADEQYFDFYPPAEVLGFENYYKT